MDLTEVEFWKNLKAGDLVDVRKPEFNGCYDDVSSEHLISYYFESECFETVSTQSFFKKEFGTFWGTILEISAPYWETEKPMTEPYVASFIALLMNDKIIYLKLKMDAGKFEVALKASSL
jgi:hypothetical protein